jgi:hypothetical protein
MLEYIIKGKNGTAPKVIGRKPLRKGAHPKGAIAPQGEA